MLAISLRPCRSPAEERGQLENIIDTKDKCKLFTNLAQLLESVKGFQAVVAAQGSGLNEAQSRFLGLAWQALEGSIERSHPRESRSLLVAAIKDYCQPVICARHEQVHLLIDESDLRLLLHVAGPLDLGSVPLVVLAELSRDEFTSLRGPSGRSTSGLMMGGKVLHQLLQCSCA